jgi:HSP20 family protein
MLEGTKVQKKNVEGTLAQRTPLHLSTFEREMERMFEDFWRRPFARFWDTDRFWPHRLQSIEVPAVDVFEEKDDVVVKAEIPGLSKEDIGVDINGSTLTIRGTKKREEKINEDDYSYNERAYGTFSRSIELPAEVKDAEVKAVFKNGVLEIRLPKTEASKKKVVKVKID